MFLLFSFVFLFNHLQCSPNNFFVPFFVFVFVSNFPAFPSKLFPLLRMPSPVNSFIVQNRKWKVLLCPRLYTTNTERQRRPDLRLVWFVFFLCVCVCVCLCVCVCVCVCKALLWFGWIWSLMMLMCFVSAFHRLSISYVACCYTFPSMCYIIKTGNFGCKD